MLRTFAGPCPTTVGTGSSFSDWQATAPLLALQAAHLAID